MTVEKKIMITGGLGFIGMNAVEHFNKGNHICVVDDCSRPGVDTNLERLEALGISHHLLDISRLNDLRDVYHSFQPDIILHLAAQVAVTTSVSQPLRDFTCNLIGSFNILELARTSQHKPIILYASTNKVYGSKSQGAELNGHRYQLPNFRGYSEKEPLSFETPYGCSKGAADQYFIEYARTYDVPTVVFRQSCIYGPNQFGMEDQGWVAWFAISALLNKPVTIYGDGNQVRDVLFVNDLLRLYEHAIEKIDKVAGQVFNIGGGPANALSINELLTILAEKTGVKLDTTLADWRPRDQKVYISDISKVQKLLDWEPTTPPSEGLDRLLAWIALNKAPIADLCRRQQARPEHELDVSIVIPAKNEEDSLPPVLDEITELLRTSTCRFEVIVVNDHSTDRTGEVARKFPFVKLVDNTAYPSGKGGALRTGFDAAAGKYIAMLDADFSHRAADMPKLLEEVFSTNGLVVASRITGGSEEYTRVRAFGNVFLTWFFGFVHGRYLSDVLNGFKVFHRDIYFNFEYTANAFDIEIELLVNTLRLGREIVEVPSRERARLAGKMKSSVIRHGPLFFWRILTEYFKK